MAQETTITTKTGMRRISSSLIVLIAAGSVAGCSQIPDAVNPVEWYNNSVEFFAGEEPAVQNAQNAQQTVAARTESAAFPKLSSVDQQKQQADVRRKGLVADIEGRKYAPAVARQGDAVNVLNAPPEMPPSTAVAVAPTPDAQPKAPVAVASINTDPVTSPSTGVPDQDKFQSRMIQHLAEIRAEANKSVQMTSNSALVTNMGNIETVIVSSTGIESGYQTQSSQLSHGAASVGSEMTYLAQPMVPLSHGAVKVATIRFENGSSRLSSLDRQILANVMRLKKERGGRIRVIGHASSRTQNTDVVKHKMINFEVSAARADAIAKELMRMGADRAQLQIDAISDSAPLYLEVMPTGEAGNRRAEIYLES